jgi:hypothetical protein
MRGFEDHMPQSEPGSVNLDTAHKPSLAYVPYLVTGRRFYADEMAFHANYAIMSTPPSGEEWPRLNGLLWENQPRGLAWALRDVADAAAYLPDNHPYKAYYGRVVTNNLETLDEYARTEASPLGFVLFGTGYDGEYLVYSCWMTAFQVWSFDHARVQTGATAGVAIRDLVAGNLIGMINGDEEGFPGTYAIWDKIRYGTRAPDYGPVTYFTTWAEVFEATFVYEDGTVEPDPWAYWPGYGFHMWMAMAVAKQAGIEGAAEALEFVRVRDNAGPGSFMEQLKGGAYAFADPDDIGTTTPTTPVDTIAQLLRKVFDLLRGLIQRLLALFT